MREVDIRVCILYTYIYTRIWWESSRSRARENKVPRPPSHNTRVRARARCRRRAWESSLSPISSLYIYVYMYTIHIQADAASYRAGNLHDTWRSRAASTYIGICIHTAAHCFRRNRIAQWIKMSDDIFFPGFRLFSVYTYMLYATVVLFKERRRLEALDAVIRHLTIRRRSLRWKLKCS